MAWKLKSFFDQLASNMFSEIARYAHFSWTLFKLVGLLIFYWFFFRSTYLLHPNVLRCDDPYWFPFRFRFHPNLQGVRLGQKSYQYWFWKCRMVVLELRHYTTCAQRARFCRVYYIIALSGTARWKISRAWETMKNPLFFSKFLLYKVFFFVFFFHADDEWLCWHELWIIGLNVQLLSEKAVE